MKTQDALRIQTWLDGALPASETRAVERLIEQDTEARDLVAELRWTQTALRAGEVPRSLPESREFYWSKIRKAIEVAEHSPGGSVRTGWVPPVLRWLAPAGIAAALAVLLTLPILRTRPEEPWASGTEIESPLSDISSFSFRSEAERMTIVWINAY